MSARFADMFGSFPTAERLAFDIRSWGGVDGYRGLFGKRLEAVLGVPAYVTEAVGALPDEHFRQEAQRLLAPHTRSAAELVADLRTQGAAFTVLHNPLPTEPGLTNDDLAALVSDHPEELVGFIRIDPRAPAAAAAEIRRGASLGLRGVTMTPFWARVPANHPDLNPVYATCTELGLPIWIHTSMYWDRQIPLTYEHPLFLDDVAARFPKLRIIAGHGGWPWVPEMVAVAWRHPNVYIDFSAFRPRHLATTGTGWDMLWYQLPRMLRSKVVLGSTWQLLGMPLADYLAEVRSLGLESDVLDAWTYGNLARILGRGGAAP